jgi:hypothetical protein
MSHHRNRADAFFQTMQLIAGDESHKNAIPLLAVHTAISLADAILVGFAGRRGNDGNHRESLDELRRMCNQRKRDLTGLKHLGWLLTRKTDFAYGDKNLDLDTDIKAALLHAQRFVTWAYLVFPEIARADL